MIKQYDLSFLDLDKILSILKNINARDHGLVGNGKSSYNFGMPILEYPELNGLKIIITKLLDDYYPKKLKLINSWFNTMHKGDELLLHRHEESIVSGAFYVNVGKDSVPLKFLNQSVKPQNGLLVLFPSELDHCTDPEKEERTVISFNTDYL